MNTVELDVLYVKNVEQCPICDSKLYAHYNTGILNILKIVCNDCDFESSGGVQINKHISSSNYKEFSDTTRMLFNNWNETVAEYNNTECKKIRIYKKKQS